MTKHQRFLLKAPTENLPEISDWQNRFESVLEHYLPKSTVQPAQLHQAMRYSALDGGKRFRPILIYASGRALGMQPSELDALACAIELIHAYSLIHDDLPAMDDDDLRRGRPSCHKAFDEATAILAGDALQALAFEILARDLNPSAETSLQLIGLIANACGSTGMAGGQALDLAAVGNELGLSQLETMHRLKTGALIHASVMAPCLLIGANSQTQKCYSTYGKCVGLAFQIHDDILDVTGDSAVTGKHSQADSALNKPTFPSILGLEESRQRAIKLRNDALTALENLPGDTSIMAWLAHYVISRDR
jgi:farnesyl diphosphate synthase